MRALLPLLLLLSTAAGASADKLRAVASALPPADCPAIQRAIDTLPASGGEVRLLARTYTCSEPIVIARNDVTLRGVGSATLLRLADSANAPVIVIGTSEAVPSTTISRVAVLDLAIDGNRAAQTFECYRGPCTVANPLRNNGITVRRASDVLVQNVQVSRARSGGLVTELVVRRITVRDFTSSDNFFDGLAGYLTEDSVFDGLSLHDNLAAGLSLDIEFNSNLVTNTVIERSGKVGIFMRDARDNVFDGLIIRNSGEHGIFLAQVDTDTSKPAAGNTFTSLVVSKSAGAGLRANDASCIDNLVAGAQFIGNRDGGITEAVAGLVRQSGVVVR